MRKATYVEVHFDDGTKLRVDSRGAHSSDPDLGPKKLFALVWEKFDHFKVIREALGLKAGEQLSKAILLGEASEEDLG